jgi:peptidoglycan/LPS O-acetylase OafA/YrhL
MSAEAAREPGESSLRASPAELTRGAGSIESGRHIPVLDGLRGIAILLVLFLHFAPYAPGLGRPTSLMDRLYVRVAETGWLGVDLFFVLSGFLITGILYDTKGSKHYFRQFYARRFLRIFPLYYAVLALFLIVLPWLHIFDSVTKELRGEAAWYWTYLYNFKVAATGFRTSGALSHFWSLAVEEQFYLIWPIVVLWLGRKHLLVICAAAVVAALACRLALSFTGYVVLPDVWTPARMDALAVGAFIAVMARQPDGLAVMRRWATPVAVAAALPLAVMLRYNVAVTTVAHTLGALLFGAILVVSLIAPASGPLVRTTASPFLTFFGRYSYALYIFHPLLLWFKPVFSLAFVPTVFGSLLPAYLLWLVMSIGATVAVALVSWHLLEKQFLKMKRFFPYHPADPPPATIAITWEPFSFSKAARS